MQLNNLRSKLNTLKPHLPGRVLVFESTGFALYGVLAQGHVTASIFLNPPAVSHNPDFSTAIGEVLKQLRAQSRFPLPKKSVLVTPSAASDLLSLPVNPKKPRPAAQMGEMVRWELEELFVRQNDLWPVGALLQGRGHITAEQRRAAESGGGATTSVESYRELVAVEQIDACLTLQEQLTAMDEDLSVGWRSQPDREAVEQFTWYGSGIDGGVRNTWVQAFQKNGLNLAQIYPRLGAALPLVDTGEDGWLLIDVQQEQWGLFQGKNGRIRSISRQPCPFGSPVPEEIADIAFRSVLPDISGVFISAPGPLAASTAAALASKLIGREIAVSPITENLDIGSSAMPPQPEIAGAEPDCPAPVLAVLHGAAKHALKRSRSTISAPIAAQAPKPPILKRKELWPWAVIALLAVGIVAVDTTMRMQIEDKQWELDKLDIEYERRLKLKKQAEVLAQEANGLKIKLAGKEAELAELQRQKEILDKVIRHRQQMVPGILEAIGEGVTDEVVLDRLEENGNRSGFSLAGWALRSTDGQRFGQRLNEALAPWNYKVDDLQMVRGKGRLDIEGYVLSIRITAMPVSGMNSAPKKEKP